MSILTSNSAQILSQTVKKYTIGVRKTDLTCAMVNFSQQSVVKGRAPPLELNTTRYIELNVCLSSLPVPTVHLIDFGGIAEDQRELYQPSPDGTH